MIQNSNATIAVIYGSRAVIGGLGMQAATALAGLATSGAVVHAFGPGYAPGWPLDRAVQIVWHPTPNFIASWRRRYTLLRWRQGALQDNLDRALGAWCAKQVATEQPQLCYGFTQVSLETLRWAKRASIPTVLDNPNGHIRYFRAVCVKESQRWFGKEFLGHPTAAMVERIEEEYELADRIRVNSAWARQSMIEHGVAAEKIAIISPPIDLARFRPAHQEQNITRPLRLCYVGSLDLRKGFPYLLEAIKNVGVERLQLMIVGATGERNCARLFAQQSVGLNVTCAPGDPVPIYQQAELFVLPTLEDGLPYVAVEAMACGLPVIVTDQCGGAELVTPGETGWVIPAGQTDALAAALEAALEQRNNLTAMGKQSRLIVERKHNEGGLRALADWVMN